MNFTQVVSEVISITKRPDKVSDIRREVNSAINFCCIGTDFARDILEATISIDPTLYTQNVLLSTLTRFRKFKYVRPPGASLYIKALDPDHVFNNGCETLNTYYVAGDQIVFKLGALSATLLIGYFRYPPTLSDSSSSFWLLDVSPYMIINKAASSVFGNIGDDASAKKHDTEFARQYLSACSDYKYGAA